MISLQLLTIMTLAYTITLPWVALMVCEKIEDARRLTILFGVGMNVCLWGFYALIGLGRLLFGLPFIW